MNKTFVNFMNLKDGKQISNEVVADIMANEPDLGAIIAAAVELLDKGSKKPVSAISIPELNLMLEFSKEAENMPNIEMDFINMRNGRVLTTEEVDALIASDSVVYDIVDQIFDKHNNKEVQATTYCLPDLNLMIRVRPKVAMPTITTAACDKAAKASEIEYYLVDTRDGRVLPSEEADALIATDSVVYDVVDQLFESYCNGKIKSPFSRIDLPDRNLSVRIRPRVSQSTKTTVVGTKVDKTANPVKQVVPASLVAESPDEGTVLKADKNKPRLDLVPLEALVPMARVREFAASKYGQNGIEAWREISDERLLAALLRHLVAYQANPEALDEESGLPAIYHVEANAMFLAIKAYERLANAERGAN